jgi:hypothetical protein
MEDAIESFSRKLRNGGVGLFYYAGHGVQVDGENYLIPIDARINRAQDIKYAALPAGRILGSMADAGNSINIVIFDACRDNPFASSSRSLTRGLVAMQAAQGSLIAYATAPGEVATDGTDRNGVYTKYLLKHIATRGQSIEEMFKKVRMDVVAATKGKQTPWESSSLVGDFSFAPEKSNTSLVLNNPPEPIIETPSQVAKLSPDPEVELWEAVKVSSNPQDFQDYLNKYPEGLYATAASVRLRSLLREEQKQKSDGDGEKRGFVTPLKRGRDILNPIADFFQTLGAAGGCIGALLVLAASLFVDVRIPIKDVPWHNKILFILSGTLVGALYYITIDGKNVEGKHIIICALFGAFWLHVVTTCRKIVENYIKGLEISILEKKPTTNTRKISKENTIKKNKKRP